MGKAHQNKKKTPEPKSEINALATRKKINTVNRKQTPPIQSILKPIWTYEIQLWGTASNSNIEILQRLQHRTLRSILNAPWFINNHMIHEDLQMNILLMEIKKRNTKYFRKLENHTNALTVNLLDNSENTHRLKRYTVLTLPHRPE
jgi:hypothetical protein